MAGSFVAIANDGGSMLWNPAGVTLVSEEKLHLASSYTGYLAGFNIVSASAVMRANRDNFWGFYAYSMNSPEMDETTELQPQGTGRTFRASSTLAGFTYGKVLTSNFGFGINTKFARETYANVAINNVLFDFGIHYKVGIKNARFAVTISNFGINVQPSGSVTILKHNAEETVDDFERVSVPAVFRIGAAFDPIEKENHKLTFSAQLNHPTDNNETLAFGLEYTVRKVVVIRSGYEFGQDINPLPPIGLGVILPRKFGQLRIDYGFSHVSSLGNIHRVSLGLALK